MVLVPECDLGIFLSVNGITGDGTMIDVLELLMERFAPESGAPPAAVATSDAPTTPAAALVWFVWHWNLIGWWSV